jgi:hypothetical protein
MARRSHRISEQQRERDRLRSAGRRSGEAAVEAEPEGADALFAAFEDILFSPDDEARSFFRVAGISWMLGKAVPPEMFWPTFRDHYTKDGSIDTARFAADFAIWPPIASRVLQIQQGRA